MNIKKLRYLLTVLLTAVVICGGLYALLWREERENPAAGDLHSGGDALREPPVGGNIGRGIKATKKYGDSALVLEVGVATPYMPRQGSMLTFMRDSAEASKYKLRLRGVKLRIEEKERSMEVRARRGLSNEDFTNIKLTGIKVDWQKGYTLRSGENIELKVRGEGVEVEYLP
jgi:hypothetical protein